MSYRRYDLACLPLIQPVTVCYMTANAVLTWWDPVITTLIYALIYHALIHTLILAVFAHVCTLSVLCFIMGVVSVVSVVSARVTVSCNCSVDGLTILPLCYPCTAQRTTSVPPTVLTTLHD